MAKLSTFRTDTRAVNDGAFVRVDEAQFGDLEIKTRGFTDAFVDAQNARLTKAALSHDGDQSRIPNAERRAINAGLLRDHLVLDVRNLEGDDGLPVTREAFLDLLDQPEYGRLMGACWRAAAKINARGAEQAAEAVGNFVPPSGASSNGDSSAPT